MGDRLPEIFYLSAELFPGFSPYPYILRFIWGWREIHFFSCNFELTCVKNIILVDSFDAAGWDSTSVVAGAIETLRPA